MFETLLKITLHFAEFLQLTTTNILLSVLFRCFSGTSTLECMQERIRLIHKSW